MSETTPGLLKAAYVRGVIVGAAAAIEAIARMVDDGMTLVQACAAVLRYVRSTEGVQCGEDVIGWAGNMLAGVFMKRVD